MPRGVRLQIARVELRRKSETSTSHLPIPGRRLGKVTGPGQYQKVLAVKGLWVVLQD